MRSALCHFGEMLDAVEKTGRTDNTIVLCVSDQGDYAAAHGLWMKSMPAFRGAYHIPAIIRWPQDVKHSVRRVDAFADQVDFSPTFLKLAMFNPRRHFLMQA
jgi:arylsulfatase A-like enzyme